MGGARNRLVHDQTEQAVDHLHQPLPGPSGIRHQRPEHGLGHSSLSVPLPSVSHLPVVLQKVKQSDNTFLFIAPIWPHQPWYPDLISPSMDPPLCLPQRVNLLVQDLPKRFWVHPNPVLFQYHAWLLSGSTSKQQVFRRALWTELPCLRETPQDASTMPSGRNFVICAILCRSCLSRCALSGGVLGAFVPENSPVGY